MSGKTIVCRCEDVTLQDLQRAAAQGFQTIEEVKRYTGLGTGPCQGKECMLPACRILAAARTAPPGDPADPLQSSALPAAQLDQPFTVRPPLYPVALGKLARSAKEQP